jgi:hypothetical protein
MEPHTDMVMNGTERRSKGSAICIAYLTEDNQAKPRLAPFQYSVVPQFGQK